MVYYVKRITFYITLQPFLLLHLLLHKPPLHAELLCVSSLLLLQFVHGSSSMKHSLPVLILWDVLHRWQINHRTLIVPTYASNYTKNERRVGGRE